MWWLIVPAIGLLGKLIIDVSSESETPPAKLSTLLERNLARLHRELCSVGTTKLAILGQPGAGKSSLLKKMSGSRVTPLPVIGAETDATDWAQLSNCNLLSRFDDYTFVDVPGYDTEAHPAKVMISGFPFSEFDAFIFVIRGKLRGADEDMYRAIARTGKRVLLARSFAESCDGDERRAVEVDLRNRLALPSSSPVMFFSNRTGSGIKNILRVATA